MLAHVKHWFACLAWWVMGQQQEDAAHQSENIFQLFVLDFGDILRPALGQRVNDI